MLGTDGLFDQPIEPGKKNPRLSAILENEVPRYPRNRVLLHPVRVRFVAAVDSAGRQHDDVCVVSVRHTTANDDLIARALDGNVAAQSEFAERFRNLVWKWVGKFFGAWSLEFQANAFQEVFAHLWAQLSKYAGGTIQAFVGRIVYNKLCDLARAGKREANRAKASGGAAEPIDPGPTPIQEAVASETTHANERRLTALREAIGKLSADDQALLQRHMADETIEEIAQSQAGKRGWSVRNIKYRLVRIKEFLRQNMTDGDTT